MKSPLAILLLLSCLVGFESCKDDGKPCILEDVKTPFVVPCKTTRDMDSTKMLIQGRWTWLQEERVSWLPPKYLTPKTEGYSIELELRNDMATYYKCGKVDRQYKFAVIKWKDVPFSGADGFPGGEWPVLIYYDVSTGLRYTDFAVLICNDYCIFQYSGSVWGSDIFKRILN